MILSFPMVVGGTLLSHEIIQFLMPDLDAGGGRVFQILLWSLPFIYANFLLGTILVATDRQKLNLVGSVCGLVCNGLANIPAIYYWGAYGASVVTIASQGLYTLILLYFCRQFLTTKGLFRYVSILASCAVMAGAIAWAALPWFLEIMLGAGVYGIALILLQGISLDDLNHLRGILRKK
jgi:O-antigen/teichoic acid export membrane protein